MSKNPPDTGIEEAIDHFVDDALREIEITEVSGGLVGIKAGDRGEGVVIEQARDRAPLGGGIGIGHHVPQALFRLPRFGEDAVQRT